MAKVATVVKAAMIKAMEPELPFIRAYVQVGDTVGTPRQEETRGRLDLAWENGHGVGARMES